MDFGRGQEGGQVYYFYEEGVDVEVGVFLEVFDDIGLYRLVFVFYYEVGGGDIGQVVIFYVSQVLCQDLGIQSEESGWKVLRFWEKLGQEGKG